MIPSTERNVAICRYRLPVKSTSVPTLLQRSVSLTAKVRPGLTRAITRRLGRIGRKHSWCTALEMVSTGAARKLIPAVRAAVTRRSGYRRARTHALEPFEWRRWHGARIAKLLSSGTMLRSRWLISGLAQWQGVCSTSRSVSAILTKQYSPRPVVPERILACTCRVLAHLCGSCCCFVFSREPWAAVPAETRRAIMGTPRRGTASRGLSSAPFTRCLQC